MPRYFEQRKRPLSFWPTAALRPGGPSCSPDTFKSWTRVRRSEFRAAFEQESTMTAHLDHKHEILLQSLLEGKLPRNLAWSEVTELVGRLGEVRPRSGNEVEFVIGSHAAFFMR